MCKGKTAAPMANAEQPPACPLVEPGTPPGLSVKNTFLNLDFLTSPAETSSSMGGKHASSSRRRINSEPPAQERVGDECASTSVPEESEESFPGTPESSPRGRASEKIVVPMPSVFNAMDCLTKMMNCVNAGAVDDLCDLATLRFPDEIIYLVSTSTGTDELRGKDRVCEMLRNWLKAFPDLHMTLEDVIHPAKLGDAVKWRSTCSGTQQKPVFMADLPLGSKTKFTLDATVYKNSDGQTTWIHWSFKPVHPEPKVIKQPAAISARPQPMYMPMYMPVMAPSAPVANSYPDPSRCMFQMDMAADLLMQAKRAQLAAASIRAQMNLEDRDWERPAKCGESKHSRKAKSNKLTLSQLESANSSDTPGQQTTLIVRNIPLEYSRQMLVDMLDGGGFAGKYDFVYIPRDFQRTCGLGYAFVNMCSHEDANLVQDVFNGYCDWEVPSAKICEVGWSSRHQGLVEQVKRYMNSPLMHECVPDEYKPILFQQGSRVDFPAPTQKLKRPRGLVDLSEA